MIVAISSNFQRVAIVTFSLVVVFLGSIKTMSIFGLFPGIVPDELSYLRQSLAPAETSDYGNALHSLVYSSVQQCDASWYMCAKGYNLFFELAFVGAVFLASYAISRRKDLSLLLSGLAFVSPFLMYGSFFMPESMHAAFLAWSLALIIWLRSSATWLAVFPAVALGAALLSKPHSFAVVLILFVIAVVWRKRDSAVALFVLSVAILGVGFRTLGGVLIQGSEALNPFGEYLGLITGIFDGGTEAELPEGGQLGAEIVASTSAWMPLATSLASAGINLLPALILIGSILGLASGLNLLRVRSLLSDFNVQLALGAMGSLVLLGAVFNFVLQFSGVEITLYRTMTRYWEHATPMFIAVVVAALYAKEQDGLGEKSPRFFRTLSGLVALSTVVLYLLPRGQNLSDSSLSSGNFLLLGLGMFIPLVILNLLKTQSKQSLAVLIVVPIIGMGAYSIVQTLNYSISEKAGVSAGLYLDEVLSMYPGDSERVSLVGDRATTHVASFLARIPDSERITVPYYDQINYSELRGNPRWVVASLEVAVIGREPKSIAAMGDSIVYEYGYPSLVKPVDFKKYGIENTDNFFNNYWGAWVDDGAFEFIVPTDVEGDTIILNLLVNDELADKRVSIDYGDGPITGEVREGQVVTPVEIVSQDGSGWAGRKIKVSYLGDQAIVAASMKGMSLGFEGFSIVQSRG